MVVFRLVGKEGFGLVELLVNVVSFILSYIKVSLVVVYFFIVKEVFFFNKFYFRVRFDFGYSFFFFFWSLLVFRVCSFSFGYFGCGFRLCYKEGWFSLEGGEGFEGICR